jgi:Na+/H+-dicarboxylate symporter
MIFKNNHLADHGISIKQLNNYLSDLIQGRLWIKVTIGLVLGMLCGILLGPGVKLVSPDTATLIGNWLALPGQLFLLLIQMIVIPLIFASVVRGLSSGGSLEQLKQMGSRVIVYFVFTTTVAISIGVWLASIIKPGKFVDSEMVQSALSQAPALKVAEAPVGLPGLAELPQKLVAILPANPLTSMVEGQMLQVVLFAIVFGFAIVLMPREQAKPLIELLSSLQEVCMTVVKVAMRLAPYAVFGLMTQLSSKIGFEALLGMAVYVGTVLLGLLILLGFYLTLVTLVGRRHPLKFLASVREVMLLAFSTSSSAAVLPMSIKTAEDKLQISPSVSQFVIPLGATINMDGTALYQGIAAIFLAQVFGIDLNMSAMLLIIVTTVGASIGAPATPGVGIVILAMVLKSVGIPVEGIALIVGVDRILDMSRTAINVCGDLTASVVISRLLGAAPQPVAETQT